jgi:hypothetical protein
MICQSVVQTNLPSPIMNFEGSGLPLFFVLEVVCDIVRILARNWITSHYSMLRQAAPRSPLA